MDERLIGPGASAARKEIDMSAAHRIVKVFPDAATLATGAAARVAELAADSIAEIGRFSIALSGGSTPVSLYSVLARQCRELVAWEHVHVWFGDERCVPHDHNDSNARMAARALLDHVPIPPRHVHLVPTNLGPAEAAAAYEHALRAFDASCPLDLVLLGLGADGHTASLFPESPSLTERERWVVNTLAPQTSPVRDRITITLPLIAASRHAMFLVSGIEKRPVIERALNSDTGPGPKPPASLVRSRGPVEWFLDAPAAGVTIQSSPLSGPSAAS